MQLERVKVCAGDISGKYVFIYDKILVFVTRNVRLDLIAVSALVLSGVR